MLVFLQLQMEYGEGTGSKKGKSWRSRLRGFFKREKKGKESDEADKKDAGSTKAKGKTKASEAPPELELEKDNAKGIMAAPPTATFARRVIINQPLPPLFACTTR